MPQKRGQKRVAYHIAEDRRYKRDMDLIFGKKGDDKVSAPKGPSVGPSDGMIDQLMARRKKFSLGTAK